MKTRIGLIALALALVVGSAQAEVSTLTEWAEAQGHTPPAGTPPTDDFGMLLGSWNPGLVSLIGLGYDSSTNGIWCAQEGGVGSIDCYDVASHMLINSFSIVAFGLTSDGNQDGCSVDLANGRLLVTDYQGDLNISDDICYSVDLSSGGLLDYWNLDGANNPNPNAAINVVLGVCVDGDGEVWMSNNEGLIHHVELLPGGGWNLVSVMGVPGGGSWAGLDYDPCIGQFFVANFGINFAQYHNDLVTPPLDSFPGLNTVTGISSNEDGIVFVGGFGDHTIYEFEGIPCNTPAEKTTWGGIKALFQ